MPLFVQMRDLQLVDTYLGVLLPSVASAFGVFLLRQAMNSVPRELDEAATLDGAGHFRIFGTIVLPLVRPDDRHTHRVRVHEQLEQLPLAADHPALAELQTLPPRARRTPGPVHDSSGT